MNEQQHFEKFKKRRRSSHRAATAMTDIESDGGRASANVNDDVRIQTANPTEAARATKANAAQIAAAKRRAVGRDTIF